MAINSRIDQWVQDIGFKRAGSIAKHIIPWLAGGNGRILDFGCGLGHIGFLISRETGREVEFYDVKEYPYSPKGVKIKAFDGKRLPCEDNEFDTTLVAFVLHHTPNPEASLKEAARVSKRHILVCEDFMKSKSEMIVETVKDAIVNFFLPHMTLQYRIEKDWEKMFEEMGLMIEKKTYFQTKYIFNFKHVAWLLAVP